MNQSKKQKFVAYSSKNFIFADLPSSDKKIFAML